MRMYHRCVHSSLDVGGGQLAKSQYEAVQIPHAPRLKRGVLLLVATPLVRAMAAWKRSRRHQCEEMPP